MESRDLIGWPGSIGGDHSSPSISREQVPSNVWPGSDTPASPIHYPTQTSIPTVAVSAVERQFNTEGLYPPYQYPPFGHNPDMGGLDNYPPSPQSDQGRQPSITTPTSLPGSVNVDHITTPGSDGSKGVQMSVKRGDPPRNAEKQIYCNHSECAGDPPTFRRPSDWK